uniref:Uncharacterized protein n=1 Tax=Rhodosorus marinus TaxID=101924 RepID=A0A7S2ZQT3_9RHOD
MSLSDLLPVADDVLKDFILHRSDVQLFDFGSSAPLMFDVTVEAHEEVMKSPFYGFLEALSKPVFTLSASYNDDVRVGMGWVFETRDPLSEYTRGFGGVHDFRDLTYPDGSIRSSILRRMTGARITRRLECLTA